MGVSNDGFSLVDEAWVLVRLVDGSPAELSLRDVFRRADDIRELDGELPTQSFAILRLLLAMLYRSLGETPLTRTVWERWRDNGLPLGRLDGYLHHHADQFDLFHAARPFFQVADLQTASGEYKDVTPLIFDLPSNNRLFTNRSGSGASDLSYAEAARWLVNAQAWDASGIKSGALGDSRVKGGKGYPIGLAWCGLLGGVYAQGANLRETLLLNLVVPGEGVVADTAADLPPWEEEEPDTSAERDELVPHGPVRLYTWQSRRIRLFREHGRVVGCLVANGDKLTPQNQYLREPMTAWRYSEPQTKAAKQTTYMPREHQAGRALWRGIGALLPGISPSVPKVNQPRSLPPGILDWLSLDYVAAVGDASTVRIRSVGVVYGSNNSVVDEVLSDEVSVPLALLREKNRALAVQAEEAVRLADEGVMHLRNLADDLVRAAGGVGDGARARATDLAYAALDGPYRSWLGELTGDEDPLAAIGAWKGRARDVLSKLGQDAVVDAGPAAWAGREVVRNGRSDLINTPRAEGRFLRGLSRTFGPAVKPLTAGAVSDDEEAVA